MQQIFSHEGLEGVDLQKLNIVWQTIGFMYGVWGVGEARSLCYNGENNFEN